ncbi:MAG: rod shape-determining protein MreC [Actinomycetota bacterium]|nr:rod shape-determining protein MreC [Actinomycetota bacterium]
MAISHRARATRLLVIGLVVTSLVTITIDYRGGDRGPLALVGQAAVSVVTPLQEAVSKVFRPVGNFLSSVANLGSFRTENARLRSDIAALRQQESDYGALQAENKRLRRILNLKERLAFNTIGATVIAEGVSNFEWSIWIDQGSSNGVKVDMPVIAAEGLVGRVVKVAGGSSQVMLLIDPRSRIAARLAGSRKQGLLIGQRDEPLALELISPDVTVRPGELVQTSSHDGGIFPDAIPIGRVERVLPEGPELTKTIRVRPNVDFSRLDHVLVVISERSTVRPQAVGPG